MTDYTSLIKEVNIPELVKALRECASDDPDCIYNCPYYNHDVCADDLKSDAADAIETLESEIKRLELERDDAIKTIDALDNLNDKLMKSVEPQEVQE